METIGLGIILLFSGVYFLLLIFSFTNWKRKSYKKDKFPDNSPSVSIIVAFKDEESNITDLLLSLCHQDYLNYKIILVNDHSLDQSVDLVRDYISERVSLFDLPKGQSGKKMALAYGIEQSDSKYILFTDADCLMPANWVSSMVYASEKETAHWLGGSVVYSGGRGLSAFFQKLESAYLVMVSALSISKNKPTTCNGANILIERTVFNEVEGFTGILKSPSGDDELLMQKIGKTGAYKLSFNYNLASTIVTRPASTWRELINQRIRWGSKLKYNLLPYNKWLSVLVFGFHLACILGLIFFPVATSIVLMIRFILELYGGRMFLSQQDQVFRFHYFVISFFVYPLYVIFMAVLTQFKSFSWKGRKY